MLKKCAQYNKIYAVSPRTAENKGLRWSNLHMNYKCHTASSSLLRSLSIMKLFEWELWQQALKLFIISWMDDDDPRSKEEGQA